MKLNYIVALVTCLMFALTAKSEWLLDTNTWTPLTPFCDSQMIMTNGGAFFLNRGILTSLTNFPTAIEITGSFEFVGNSYDQFQINLRTDGSLYDPAKNFALGTYVSFGGGDAPLNSPNNVKVEDDLGGRVAQTTVNFSLNTFYNFRITDDGNAITLYLSNLTSPFLTLNTTNRQGGAVNKIDMENGRGNCGGDPISNGAGIVLNSLTVKEFLNLNIYTAIELSFFAQSNTSYQIQSSTDLTTWSNDTQIQGYGSNWFKTYSTRGPARTFYRVELLP